MKSDFVDGSFANWQQVVFNLYNRLENENIGSALSFNQCTWYTPHLPSSVTVNTNTTQPISTHYPISAITVTNGGSGYSASPVTLSMPEVEQKRMRIKQICIDNAQDEWLAIEQSDYGKVDLWVYFRSPDDAIKIKLMV